MNKHCFRLIFSKPLGFLIPVAEITTAQRKPGQQKVCSAASVPLIPPILSLKRLVLSVLLAAAPGWAAAEILLDRNFGGTSVGSAANGVPVIEISATKVKANLDGKATASDRSEPGTGPAGEMSKETAEQRAFVPSPVANLKGERKISAQDLKDWSEMSVSQRREVRAKPWLAERGIRKSDKRFLREFGLTLSGQERLTELSEGGLQKRSEKSSITSDQIRQWRNMPLEQKRSIGGWEVFALERGIDLRSARAVLSNSGLTPAGEIKLAGGEGRAVTNADVIVWNTLSDEHRAAAGGWKKWAESEGIHLGSARTFLSDKGVTKRGKELLEKLEAGEPGLRFKTPSSANKVFWDLPGTSTDVSHTGALLPGTVFSKDTAPAPAASVPGSSSGLNPHLPDLSLLQASPVARGQTPYPQNPGEQRTPRLPPANPGTVVEEIGPYDPSTRQSQSEPPLRERYPSLWSRLNTNVDAQRENAGASSSAQLSHEEPKP